MTTKDVLEVLDRITSKITSGDLSPAQGVQFAYLEISALKSRLMGSELQALVDRGVIAAPWKGDRPDELRDEVADLDEHLGRKDDR
jgi:hypothetical protein